MDYTVVNYSDFGNCETMRRTTRNANEALDWARETPHAALAAYCDEGWSVQTMVFSPKHPVRAAYKMVKRVGDARFASGDAGVLAVD